MVTEHWACGAPKSGLWYYKSRLAAPEIRTAELGNRACGALENKARGTGKALALGKLCGAAESGLWHSNVGPAVRDNPGPRRCESSQRRWEISPAELKETGLRRPAAFGIGHAAPKDRACGIGDSGLLPLAPGVVSQRARSQYGVAFSEESPEGWISGLCCDGGR